jgi:U6 snRNA-associated Sm-like protein LSm7
MSVVVHLVVFIILPEPEPHKRTLGLVVLRGPTITLLSPVDGSEEIENPFLAAE